MQSRTRLVHAHVPPELADKIDLTRAGFASRGEKIPSRSKFLAAAIARGLEVSEAPGAAPLAIA